MYAHTMYVRTYVCMMCTLYDVYREMIGEESNEVSGGGNKGE